MCAVQWSKRNEYEKYNFYSNKITCSIKCQQQTQLVTLTKCYQMKQAQEANLR